MKNNKERNQKIYNRYLESGLSFNKLSKEFNLTPQRIQKIVSDYKLKEVAKPLSPTANQKERDIYKNLGVETRENGKLELALKMLEQVVLWDETNKNYRGMGDALGHINIVYTRLSDNSKVEQDKSNYLVKSIETLDKVIKLQEKKLVPEGSIAITLAQIAGTKNRLAVTQNSKEKIKTLAEALKIINKSIKDLPGSEAHKAWPLKIKAQILAHMEKYEEAIEVLALAEKHLYLGYNQELNWQKERKIGQKGNIGNDQAAMKIQVWLIGIQNTYAEIFEKTGRELLAKFYASAVVNAKDEEGILKEAKKKAKEILERVS